MPGGEEVLQELGVLLIGGHRNGPEQRARHLSPMPLGTLLELRGMESDQVLDFLLREEGIKTLRGPPDDVGGEVGPDGGVMNVRLLDRVVLDTSEDEDHIPSHVGEPGTVHGRAVGDDLASAILLALEPELRRSHVVLNGLVGRVVLLQEPDQALSLSVIPDGLTKGGRKRTGRNRRHEDSRSERATRAGTTESR